MESRNLFQRRPIIAAPVLVAGKTEDGVYRRRKRLVSSSDRTKFVALALVAMFISFGLLMSHFLGRGGSKKDQIANNSDIVRNQNNNLVKMWKPRTVERTNENNGGLNSSEKRLRAALDVKELGRRALTTNNDEQQANSARTAKTKKNAKVNKHSSYRPKFDESELGYDIENCPPTPPPSYPKAWKATEVLTNWNPNDVTIVPPAHRDVYHGLCIFDYQTQYDIAKAYRDAERPFIIRNDPNVMAASKRWYGNPNYLRDNFPDEKVYTERSPINHFMFYTEKKKHRVESWSQPKNDITEMTYREWLERALEREANVLGSPEISELAKKLREERMKKGETDDGDPPEDDEIKEDHDTEEEKRLKWYYLRINGWLEDADEEGTDKFVFDELKFFDPRKKDSDFYMIDKKKQRGINCRFGMRGIIAENHMDLSRNTIALLGGERRYIIAHPEQCTKMGLYPHEHPSGRHSSFDWCNPTEWDIHPEFKEARVSEVVMHAGDVLYLPTAWFHYIVNLSINIQCNIRSGIGEENMNFVNECGFDPR